MGSAVYHQHRDSHSVLWLLSKGTFCLHGLKTYLAWIRTSPALSLCTSTSSSTSLTLYIILSYSSFFVLLLSGFFPCRSFELKPLCQLHTHAHGHTKARLSSRYRLTDQEVSCGPAATAEAAAV